MKKIKKISVVSILLVLLFGAMSACKNNDPSVLKIYVRSASNELLEGARVVIIGDVTSNPPTVSYVDTVFTNSSGFVEINMANYFVKAGEENTVGYFDVIAEKNNKSAQDYVRCRKHITTVETLYLIN
jgi:hypothetical protein